MPTDEPGTTDRPHHSRARLRRSGRQLVRVGAVLTVVSLVVTLVAGFMTRSMVNHLQDNSAELLDGSATVTLREGTDRTLYVTGGLIAPGELVPTPVEQISCRITGPDGRPVDLDDRTADRVGVDLAVARIQVVGHFTAAADGEHVVECDGLGVVISPEVSPASVVARIGGLALGSLGTILGVTMMLIGGVLLLLRRDDEDEEELVDEDLPPEEGAEEWWEEERSGRGVSDGDGTSTPDAGADDGQLDEDGADDGELDEDDYVELTEEELASFTDEELEELVASGAIVFVDEDEDPDEEGPHQEDRAGARGDRTAGEGYEGSAGDGARDTRA